MALRTVPNLDQVGHREWKKASVTLAQSLNATAGPAGALGFLLPDEEYMALSGGSSFVPLEKPDPTDEAKYKILKREYDREQEANATLRREVFASVPTPVLEHTPGYDPEYGVLRIDLRVLWVALRKRAHFATQAIYEKALAALAVPYAMGHRGPGLPQAGHRVPLTFDL